METDLQQPQQQPQLPSDETHPFFEALYSGLMTVDKLLEILKQFRSSSIQKEKVWRRLSVVIAMTFIITVYYVSSFCYYTVTVAVVSGAGVTCSQYSLTM